jgi:hypothetical protein
VLAALSIDIWAWNEAEPFVFFLPLWVWYVMLLTLSFAAAFYLFSRCEWGDA